MNGSTNGKSYETCFARKLCDDEVWSLTSTSLTLTTQGLSLICHIIAGKNKSQRQLKSWPTLGPQTVNLCKQSTVTRAVIKTAIFVYNGPWHLTWHWSIKSLLRLTGRLTLLQWLYRSTLLWRAHTVMTGKVPFTRSRVRFLPNRKIQKSLKSIEFTVCTSLVISYPVFIQFVYVNSPFP